MKIVCGLGNPGRQYEGNRHNVGFMVVDELAVAWKAPPSGTKFDADVATVSVGAQKVLLLKPRTFMNLSGTALGAAARFFKVSAPDVLVVHDELDLPFGRLQLKQGGGTGGHNGLNSIAESWGEADYGRLRFGIDKPQGPGAKDRVVGHVLGDFRAEERAELPGLVKKAAALAEAWVRLGMSAAMNQHNRREKAGPKPSGEAP